MAQHCCVPSSSIGKLMVWNRTFYTETMDLWWTSGGHLVDIWWTSGGHLSCSRIIHRTRCCGGFFLIFHLFFSRTFKMSLRRISDHYSISGGGGRADLILRSPNATESSPFQVAVLKSCMLASTPPPPPGLAPLNRSALTGSSVRSQVTSGGRWKLVKCDKTSSTEDNHMNNQWWI